MRISVLRLGALPPAFLWLLWLLLRLSTQVCTLRQCQVRFHIALSARAVACVGDTGQSARNAAFSCDIGESARNAALSCDTGKSARNAALPCETGDSARIVALPCDSGRSVNTAASPSNACKCSDGHSAHPFHGDAGDVAPDVVSSRHAVKSTCLMVHDGLGGGASKLCSHISF